MDVATWSAAILALKDCLALVTLLWLLVHTYTKVLPTQLAALQAPVVLAVQALSNEMKEIRNTLIEALRRPHANNA